MRPAVPATLAALLTTLTSALAAALVTLAPTGSPTPAAAAPRVADGTPTLTLSRSVKATHQGQRGAKIVARVRNGSAAGKGTVKFRLDGASLGRWPLVKGKAKLRLADTLEPGRYAVTAKYGKLEQTVRVRVWDSALTLSASSFTIAKSDDNASLPTLSGSVRFKGAAPDHGFVDVYEDGQVEGGRESPYYCCFDRVDDDGDFAFSPYVFFARVRDGKKPGTYTYQAFFTPDPAYADYIYSRVITVRVTP